MLSDDQSLEVANAILVASRAEDVRLHRVREYLRGTYPIKAYIPRNPENLAAHREYLAILERSRQPMLSLVPDQLTQQMFVVGYRPARAADNAPGWARWQANRMDARQSGLHHAIASYGYAYLAILPGQPVPVWRPVSPRRGRAMFSDLINDEWPTYFLEEWTEGSASGMRRRWRLYDAEAVYEMTSAGLATTPLFGTGFTPTEVLSRSPHPAGVCPVVRYTGPVDLDGECLGEIEPLIPLQDQVDASTFYVEMAEQYAVHRQRFVSGMAIPEDDEGNPVAPFQMAIDRLLVSEDPDTKFGEFEQTDVTGWLEARKAAQRVMAIKAQVPPGYMLGDIPANLSAEAVAATEAPAMRRGNDYRTAAGEGHEQAFRLDALMAGDESGWLDTSSQVVWDDTASRSLAQVADALGKLASQLGIPARGLWEKIPGVTDQDLANWDTMRAVEQERAADMAARSFGVDRADAAAAE